MGKKLAELGVIWIDDSSIYVGDKTRYENQAEFLRAVIKHIEDLIIKGSEMECGWYKNPGFENYIGVVCSARMRYYLRGDHGEWCLEDEPFVIRGVTSRRLGTDVWCIDFEHSTSDMVMKRMTGSRLKGWKPKIEYLSFQGVYGS